MANEEIFRVNVIAYTRLADNRTLYDGQFYDSESGELNGIGLIECSDKTIQPGFFADLGDLVEAIETGLKNDLKELIPIQRKDAEIHFTSVKNEEDGDAYLDSSGSYLQRTLNEVEFRELLSQTETRFRPRLYEE